MLFVFELIMPAISSLLKRVELVGPVQRQDRHWAAILTQEDGRTIPALSCLCFLDVASGYGNFNYPIFREQPKDPCCASAKKTANKRDKW